MGEFRCWLLLFHKPLLHHSNTVWLKRCISALHVFVVLEFYSGAVDTFDWEQMDLYNIKRKSIQCQF